MKQRILYVFGLFVIIALLFFYPIFKGNIPFPGDLVVGGYAPYNTYSYHGYAPAAYPNKGQDFDVLLLLYPIKQFSIEQLRNGEIPLWNPYTFAGNPHLATLQSGTFYPVNILFFMLSFNTAWTFYILLQPILAGFFSYLFLRKLKLAQYSSILGGIVFAFSSYSTVWLEFGNLIHVVLWLPLILYFILSILSAPRFYKYIVLIFLLSLTILAGYIQSAIYIFIFSFIFFLCCLFAERRIGKLRQFILFGIVFTIPLGVTALQILPLTELFLSSTRSEYSAQTFIKLLIPFYHLITFVVPDFFGNPATRNYFLNGTYIERVSYIGIIPAFLAVYAAFIKKNRMMWFFLGSAIIVFFLVFNTPISRLLYSLFIPPIISTGVPSRLIFLFIFPMSVLAAFGLDSISLKPEIKKIGIVALLFITVFIGLWLYVLFGNTIWHGINAANLAVSKRNLIVPSVLLIVGLGGIGILLFTQKLKQVVLVCLILLTALDLFYFFKKITPFSPEDTIYPTTAVMENLRKVQGEDRSWGYGAGKIETNLQITEEIYGVEGYEPLHLKRFAEFLSLSEHGTISKNIRRTESLLPVGFGNDDLKLNKNRKRVMDILGIKYILTKVDEKPETPNELTFPTSDYLMIWNDSRWQMYENKKSLPRIYLAGNIVLQKDRDAIAKTLMDESFDLRTSAVVEQDLTKQKIALDPDSSAIIASYVPNRVIIKTQAKTNTLLVLTDNYYEGWKALVDGRQAPIYRTNYTFRGVVIPQGNHVVEFVYAPASFAIGKAISIGTIILLVGSLIVSLFVIHRRRRKNV